MKKPPPLKNDCFALPQGTNWTPVDDALERLKSVSKCLVETEKMSAKDAIGRILATNIPNSFAQFFFDAEYSLGNNPPSGVEGGCQG